MAWHVCRCMFVFIGLSCISVNLSVPCDSIDIYKQPYGRKMCESLCQSISGCSSIEYSYDSLSCHVKSGRTSNIERRMTSENSKPMRKTCAQHSRILTTRKGHSVCVRDKREDKKTEVQRFQMTDSRLYYLGDYKIEVIGRTSLLMRLNASGKVEVTFWQRSPLKDDGKHIHVTMGQNKTVLIHVFSRPNNTYHWVNLTEPFWKSCGFTELWFRWNNTGFLSLGKGWIPGRNLVIQYQSKAEFSFSTVTVNRMVTLLKSTTLKRRTNNEVVTVEVKNDGHRSIINCSDDKNKVRFKMDAPGSYVLNDYGLPIIGQSSIVMTFAASSRFMFKFSQEHDIANEDRRKVIINVKNKFCLVNVRFCGRSTYTTYNYRPGDNKKVIWLKWDQTGYLEMGSGRTPGVNSYLDYQGNSTLLVNYITIKLPHPKFNYITIKPKLGQVTVCNK